MTSVDGKTRLRFRIDTDVCAGHGRCYALDPDHFESDDVGYAQVIDKAERADKRRDMEEIVMACPEGAISIEQVTG